MLGSRLFCFTVLVYYFSTIVGFEGKSQWIFMLIDNENHPFTAFLIKNSYK